MTGEEVLYLRQVIFHPTRMSWLIKKHLKCVFSNRVLWDIGSRAPYTSNWSSDYVPNRWPVEGFLNISSFPRLCVRARSHTHTTHTLLYINSSKLSCNVIFLSAVIKIFRICCLVPKYKPHLIFPSLNISHISNY